MGGGGLRDTHSNWSPGWDTPWFYAAPLPRQQQITHEIELHRQMEHSQDYQADISYQKKNLPQIQNISQGSLRRR